jgi:choline-sulfatase
MSRTSLLVCLLALGACGSEPDRPQSAVVIVIDTLRADRMGSAGCELGLTPGMDTFAEQAVVFEQAFNHAPWTLPACASILSGLHPKEHGAGGQLGQFRGLDAQVATLPKAFGAQGYRTHAIVNVAFLGDDFGVTRDFDSVDAEFYSTNVEVRRAGPTTDAALKWLKENSEQPFLLFVHYFDPHAVYDPPQPFRRRYAAEADKEDESFVFGTREHMMKLRQGFMPASDVIRRAEKLYNGEVAYTDSQVERLLDGIKLQGLDPVLVITGDHGEEFLDHEGFEHGHTLYDELCHIPLMVKAPGLTPGRVQAAVRHVDLAPTLCELCGVPPSTGFVGRSLLDLAQGRPEAQRTVLAHGNMWGPPLTSFRDERWKLIVDGAGKAQLYDWRADPHETQDLAAKETGELERLQASLNVVAGHMEALQRGGNVDLTAETQALLDGLGYGGGDDAEDDKQD